MKRYCVSQDGSNVICVFSTREQADERLQLLGGNGVLWFVQANNSHPVAGEAHRLLQFTNYPGERPSVRDVS
jgi:hypothetical protein